MAEPVSGLSEPAPRRFSVPTQGRFLLAYLVLAIAVGAAVGAFVVLLDTAGGSSDTERPAWLTEHGTAAAKQIGEHIAPHYRLEDGQPLANVIAGPPQIQPSADQQLRISHIVIRPGFADDRFEDIKVFDTSHSVVYFFCGTGSAGQRCSLPGQPSVARGLLLRREAVDLALYTFKYVPDFDSVIVFVPPAEGDDTQRLLYFRRSELESQLDDLLEQTLALGPVRSLATVSQRELARAQELTLPNPGRDRFSGFYRYAFEQSPDLSAYLIIAPAGG